MVAAIMSFIQPLALCLQPACVKHRWIRTPNASHIYERPERIKAVLLGAAAAVSHLEASDDRAEDTKLDVDTDEQNRSRREVTPDVSDLLGSLNISETTPKKSSVVTATLDSPYLHLPDPVFIETDSGQLEGRSIHTNLALQVVHTSMEDMSLLSLANRTSSSLFTRSPYLKQLSTWAIEAPEKIRRGECEIPAKYFPGVATHNTAKVAQDEGIELNQNDLYLAPGSVEAIEGCVSGHGP
jgi:histone deacetylase HOS3